METSSNHDLEQLLFQLERLQPRPRDAIDRVLAAAPRSTAAVALRDHEVIRRFRSELESSLVQLDTANQLLRLISSTLQMVPTP